MHFLFTKVCVINGWLYSLYYSVLASLKIRDAMKRYIVRRLYCHRLAIKYEHIILTLHDQVFLVKFLKSILRRPIQVVSGSVAEKVKAKFFFGDNNHDRVI